MTLSLREPEREEPARPGSESRAAPREKYAHRLCCARCGAVIAAANASFAMPGHEIRAVFANPQGRVFEIVTLRHAENVVAVTPPTTEASWFAGYAWRVVLCGACSAHLGWSFHATLAELAPPRFFGFIVDALSDAPDEAN